MMKIHSPRLGEKRFPEPDDCLERRDRRRVGEGSPFAKVVPWLAGIGMGLGHAAVASRCTVPYLGRCSQCGSCLVVVVSLLAGAVAKKRDGKAFYQGD